MNFVKFLAKFWIVLAIFLLISTSDQVEGQRRPGLRKGGPRNYNNYYQESFTVKPNRRQNFRSRKV
jgi:hypothetical protein